MTELWFAWRPVRLVTGKWAWLRNVHRTRRGTVRFNPETDRTWWEYSL